MSIQKYIAELFGTFTLTLAVLISVNSGFPIVTPIIAALTLGLFVYTIGHISGTHINPAVTLGLLSIKKIGVKEAFSYIVAQVIGALLALTIATALLPTINPLPLMIGYGAFTGEFIGAFLFTFGIASVVFGKANSVMSGFVVGTSLLMGIVLASSGSLGILNPAVSIALLGSLSVSYILGPILGAVGGMWAFKALSKEA